MVLYFYPADDTPGCTAEACAFRDLNEELLAENATVWGLSPQGASSKAAFRSKYGLPFDLLADEDHAVAERYGAWMERERDGARRSGVGRVTFLIDPTGHIARVWPKVTPADHAREVLDVIKTAAGAASGAAAG